MFGLSGEHLLILAAILLIFGPRRLPELGASIGKAMRNFKEGFNTPNTTASVEHRDVPKVEAKPAAPASVVTNQTAATEQQHTSV